MRVASNGKYEMFLSDGDSANGREFSVDCRYWRATFVSYLIYLGLFNTM